MWDDQAVVVEELVKKRGNTISAITPEEATRWRKATEPVIESWMKQVKERGIDGAKYLDAARALVAKYEKA
jgi:hypothetical protein